MPGEKRVVALGFFDGVHLGHKALLEKTKELAKTLGAEPAVLSFDTHPEKLIFGRDVKLINGADGRRELIRRLCGIERVVFLHFDREMMETVWSDFILSTVEDMKVAAFVIGEDFVFGRGGKGTALMLGDFCKERGLGCAVVPEVRQDGIRVSSSYIRTLIEAGDIGRANLFLGHPHTLHGTVQSGRRLGRNIGAPTINIYMPEEMLVPRLGVYATRVFLDGAGLDSVTNIGARPTVDGSGEISVESHILDFRGDLYGKEVRIELYSFLRPERKFDSVEELRGQISSDEEKARRYLKEQK